MCNLITRILSCSTKSVFAGARVTCVCVCSRSHHLRVLQSGWSVHADVQSGLGRQTAGQEHRGDAGRVSSTTAPSTLVYKLQPSFPTSSRETSYRPSSMCRCSFYVFVCGSGIQGTRWRATSWTAAWPVKTPTSWAAQRTDTSTAGTSWR